MKTSCERCGAPRPAAMTSPCERCGGLDAGEASGLIDVRRIAVTPRPPSQPRLGGLLPAPVLASSPPPRPASRPVRASQAPLYAMIGLLSFGVVGLAAASLRGPEPAAASSTRILVAAAPELPAPDDEQSTRPLPELAAPATLEAPEPTPPPASPPAGEPQKRRTRGEAANKPAHKPTATDKPASEPEPAAGPRPDEVGCLLAPEKCKKQAAPATPAPASPAPNAPGLPETLSLGDITEGMRAAKSAATTTCKSLAKGGEVVRLKVSIAGPTGAVIKAGAEDDAGNPELARCCADELMKAAFRPVQKPQIGATATIKF